MNVYYLLITILFNKISTLYSEEIYKIIIANDMNDIKNHKYSFKTKGIKLIFDPNSSINVMPINIETEYSENCFKVTSEDKIPYIVPIDNGYLKLKSIFSDKFAFPAVNLILKNYGITFSTNYLFKKTDNKVYEFLFLLHKDAENLIIGKDLIELMDINFENGVEIRNKDFVIKLNDG